METTLTAVEATATIDEHNQLKLDHPLPISAHISPLTGINAFSQPTGLYDKLIHKP